MSAIGFPSVLLDVAEEIRKKCFAEAKKYPVSSLPTPPNLQAISGYVMEQESGFILGEKRSLSAFLPVPRESVGYGECWVIGRDFPQLRAAGVKVSDFILIALVGINRPLSFEMLSRLSAVRSLANRVPGYMARSSGTEVFARVHHDLLDAGFSLLHLAGAVRDALQADFSVDDVLLIVGTETEMVHSALLPVLAGFMEWREAFRRAQFTPEGAEGCEGRSCGSCSEKAVCDRIRSLIARKNFDDYFQS